MEHLLNVSAIKEKMNDKPNGQRLHNFFNQGFTGALTKDQIAELEGILRNDHRNVMTFLKEIKRSLPKVA